LAENTQEWSLIWSRYEKSQHNFSVNLDMDEVARNPTRKDAFALTVEGRMDDSNTSPRELLSYILEVENSVGKTDLFPRTVELDKLKGSYYDVPNPFKSSADLGSSHFYYQLMLNPQQVQKFIEYPESKMWTALEKAFHPEDIWPAWLWPDGSWSARWKRYLCNFACFPVTVMDVPLNLFQLNLAPGTDLLYAQWIHNQWVELKKIENIKDRAEALVQMFFDRLYSRTLIYLLRSTLEGENIDYYVNATNGAIGKVVKEGGSKLVYDDVATRANEAIEFDRHGSRLPGPNPMLKIENFSADPSGSDVKLTFELAETPKKLYFDVSYDDGRLSPFRNNGLTALVVENKGNFFKGLNIIILDPKDFDDPMLDISRTLEKKGKYTLRMAASQDGLTWGETVERTFRVF